jgi:UDP-GlcNAc:undecaprenyl-phosphate/decaprenyl-phosphate GlcNAc-1-phosphate transferase
MIAVLRNGRKRVSTAREACVEESTFLIIFVIAAVVTFFATRTTMVLAHRAGVLDQPGVRTFHRVATPRLGGLGIVAGISIALLVALAVPDLRIVFLVNLHYLAGLLLAGAVIIGLGLYDDLFGANAWKKFSFQFLAAGILVYFGFSFQIVSLFGFRLDLNGFGGIATMIWIVAVINAVNFIDGMDGLAASIALMLAVVFAVISFLERDFIWLVVMIALAGSLAGFLPLNRRPAKIFMGDTGSMFLGLLFAALTVAERTKSPASILLAGPMLALSLPILDSMFVAQGRFFQPGLRFAERVFRTFNADRNHFHHRLYAHFGSQAKVLATMWALTLLFGVASILTVIREARAFGYGIALAGLAAVVTLRVICARRQRLTEVPEGAGEADSHRTILNPHARFQQDSEYARPA